MEILIGAWIFAGGDLVVGLFVCLFVPVLFGRMRWGRGISGSLGWLVIDLETVIGVICISVITFWFFHFFVLFKWHVSKDLAFFILEKLIWCFSEIIIGVIMIKIYRKKLKYNFFCMKYHMNLLLLLLIYFFV